MISSLFDYRFLQNAVIAGILASIVCGIIGVIIVEKKLVMMSGGIAHTSYGGVGLGFLLNFEPIIGAFIFSLLAALGIGYIKRKSIVRSDVIIGLFWSLGMALGVIVFTLMPGYPPDLNSYLFGNILSVTRSNLYLMFGATLIVIIIIVSLFDYWKAYLFDDEFATIIGVKTAYLEYLLMILIAITVVVLIRVVGIILVIALLTAPAATAGMLTNNLKKRMIYAIVFGNLFSFIGIWISYELNISTGAAIVVISTLSFFLTYLGRFLFKKHDQKLFSI